MHDDAGTGVDVDAVDMAPLDDLGVADRPDSDLFVGVVLEVLAIVVGDRIETVAGSSPSETASSS